MSDDIGKKIGNIIRKLRHEKSWTQEVLAEYAFLSVNYIGDIELARKDVSLRVVEQISNAFDIRLDELFGMIYKGEYKMEIDKIKSAYKKWKELNLIIANDMFSRKVNLPEFISENIACYALNLTRNMILSGDATDENSNLIEIKATSNYNSDLTSFSPKTQFNRLIFVRMNLEEDNAYIYDLNMNWEKLLSLKVNKEQTFADQQNEGKRPRLSLIKHIEENKINHIEVVSML